MLEKKDVCGLVIKTVGGKKKMVYINRIYTIYFVYKYAPFYLYSQSLLYFLFISVADTSIFSEKRRQVAEQRKLIWWMEF